MQTSIFTIEWFTVFIAGVGTLAIYSFLWKENPFYRIFEHLYIGVAAGVTTVIATREFFWAQVVKPMIGYDSPIIPIAQYQEPESNLQFYYLIPCAFGLLYYFIFSKKHGWLAQLVIGLGLGASAGMAFQGIFNELMPQVFDSFRPLWIPGDLFGTFSNILFTTTLLCTALYFLFTFRATETPALKAASSTGRWLMMGCFGAFFGSTIMARMALLVDRLRFLLTDWLEAIF